MVQNIDSVEVMGGPIAQNLDSRVFASKFSEISKLGFTMEREKIFSGELRSMSVFSMS
jgi:hypothetical protein